MKISKSKLPNNSILKLDEKTYHYIDSFESIFIDKNNNITSAKIGKLFFMSGPKWVEKLFAFRNKIVGILGLKTAGKIIDRQNILDKSTFEEGVQIGLFKVFNKTNDEIVLGEDDKHLNFRVSLFIEQQNINNTNKKLTISTTVTFNNWFGKLYFLPVKPFHKLIVPTILRGIIQNIENLN